VDTGVDPARSLNTALRHLSEVGLAPRV